MSKSRLESTSKFLSLILRHAPETIGIQLDANGWADVAELLEKAAQHGKPITRELLNEVVATSDKKRFAFSADEQSIRANQGHSVAAVDLELRPTPPPPVLYHGTASRFVDSIKATGLRSQSRNHVHLSSQMETAVSVGKRHGSPVVLTIQAQAMHAQGHPFYLSENGVWLTADVPAAFIGFP
ncbi:putative RNA 2'-phosphotransferase [Duganella sp. SG902]|uniref:RNA 2'-phosphotransferase n=1 Tax=Duganella sp. SG902 TaxID=2587016 RepID=UPI00159DB9FE|nr:RNA 2'-phosphotransferase [Duganella sp. SG902]NVM74669.1 putative RNA 2'-phosphotransferase [Duganella sp. SG902]